VSSFSENPVYTVLNKILQLVDHFASFAYVCANPMCEIDKRTFESFESIFANLVDSLLKMLSGLQVSAPLAQLLLRLDFNYWFSTKSKAIQSISKS
jgi:Gamma tubulin complex component C-terminal